MEQLEEERKNLSRYHKGIYNGQVKSSGSRFEEELKELAKPAVKDDEVPALLQEGEFVYQPDQIENTLSNVRRIAVKDMAQLLPHLRVNPLENSVLTDTQNVTDYVDVGRTGTALHMGGKEVQNTLNCSIGDIHLHEVQNVNGLAEAINNNLGLLLSQKYSKYFK